MKKKAAMRSAPRRPNLSERTAALRAPFENALVGYGEEESRVLTKKQPAWRTETIQPEMLAHAIGLSVRPKACLNAGLGS